jgi:uncharacterized membrane protein
LTEQAHAIADLFARWLELAGVAIIVLGVALAAAAFLRRGLREAAWREAYQSLRSNLGRGILLGLELLVGADIISTITAPLTVESVGLLGAIVVIRTSIPSSIETESAGSCPWGRPPRDAAIDRPPQER